MTEKISEMLIKYPISNEEVLDIIELSGIIQSYGEDVTDILKAFILLNKHRWI